MILKSVARSSGGHVPNWRARTIGVLAATSLMLSSLAASAPTSEAAITSLPKPITYSIYVESLTATDLYNRGVSLGESVADVSGTQTAYAILDFGALYNNSSTGWMVTKHGGTNTTDNATVPLVEAFAHGFWIGTGSDLGSTLYLGMGVNNSSTISNAGGKAWADRVNTANDYVRSNYNQVYVLGAADLEPGFGSDTQMRAFVDGYNTNHDTSLLDYGSADGCSTTGVPSSCNNGWSAGDVWYAAWGGANLPFPEIYTESGSQAKQWKYLSLWSVQNKGYPLTFFGALTQHKACDQRGGCSGTDNPSAEGWQQLYDQIKGNSQTAPGGTYIYRSDIRWN